MRPARQLQAYLRMRREGRLSADELARLQDERVRAFVAAAYESVPFVHDLLDSSGVAPADIRGASDLAMIPITTKRQLQTTSLERLLAAGTDPRRCVRLSTSGSSGIPLNLYFHPADFTRTNMNWFRAQTAWGIRPFHRALEITGPHNFAGRRPWYQRLGLWRREQISVFEPVEAWAERWRSLRPDILYGYSGSLGLLARYALERGPLVPRPKFVVGVSDLCPEPTAELIREAFGREVIDLYGAAETGCISWKCPRCRGYHINVDTLVLQVCDGGRTAGRGQRGRVIVTNLFSAAMPVLRYDLGDIARMSPDEPECGSGLPLLEIIEGRADALLTLPSGRVLSPMFFYATMKPVQGLDAWRVVQEENGSLTLLAVPSPDASPDWPDLLRRRVIECLGEPAAVEVRPVDSLSPDASGKVRSVISLKRQASEKP